MNRPVLIMMLFFAVLFTAGAQISVRIETADDMDRAGKHEELIVFLEKSLEDAQTPARQAEVYWRVSRAVYNRTILELFTGDITEDAAKRRLQEGEQYARQAVDWDPSIPEAYFWQAANRGRRSLLEGVLNALSKADDIRDLVRETLRRRPDHPESYYLLGQLYRELPGGIISFGNDDYAVSLGRRAVDLHEREYRQGLADQRWFDLYTELAKSLRERGWDAERRREEQQEKADRYRQADGPLERGFFYEGTVDIPNRSDREEAVQRVRWVVEQLEQVEGRSIRQEMDFAEARETLQDWE